jgi:hypothetical protein
MAVGVVVVVCGLAQSSESILIKGAAERTWRHAADLDRAAIPRSHSPGCGLSNDPWSRPPGGKFNLKA